MFVSLLATNDCSHLQLDGPPVVSLEGVVLDVYPDGGDECVVGGRVEQFLQDAGLAYPRVAHHHQLVAGVPRTAAGAATTLGPTLSSSCRTFGRSRHTAAKTHGFVNESAGIVRDKR